MATEQLGFSIGSEVADADLSAKQFYGVKFSSTGVALCSTAGEVCDGFLQNKPVLGETCNVMVFGKTKAVAGAALAKGALVSITAAGKLKAAASGEYVVGKLLEAAAADGDIVGLLVTRPGRVA